MHYRKLIDLDVPAIARVHRRACLVAYTFMNWSYSETECRTWYLEKFKEWDWGLIAQHHLTSVGFIAATGTHLDQLFVDPNYQRRGIGTYLLTEALTRQAPIATLSVFKQNTAARRFYERHGFRETKRLLNEHEQAVELIYTRT